MLTETDQQIMKTSIESGTVLTEIGSDTYGQCLDKELFTSFDKKITYEFNSMGYRDKEWPTDTRDVIWCVGDSQTLGVGQPFNEAWPQILQRKTEKHCINISECGCSNDTLKLRTHIIDRSFNPKNIVIMWSFFNRRRKNGKDCQLDKDDFGLKADMENFARNFISIKKIKSNVIHTLVPNALIDTEIFDFEKFKYVFKKSRLIDHEDLENILFYPVIDYARDSKHFGVKTSNLIVDSIIPRLKNLDHKAIIK